MFLEGVVAEARLLWARSCETMGMGMGTVGRIWRWWACCSIWARVDKPMRPTCSLSDNNLNLCLLSNPLHLARLGIAKACVMVRLCRPVCSSSSSSSSELGNFQVGQAYNPT